MDRDALRAEIEAFLAAHHTVSLATVDDQGAPHAANLLYACDGLAIYWMSDTESRHSCHIEKRPIVTATVAPDYEDFRSIRGLQIFGTARRLSGAQSLGTARRMISRYGFLAELASGPAALRAAFEKAGFYCLIPSRITYIDNTRGFGHKETLELPTEYGG
ncbi:MAG: hypothetical protein A3G25_19700 [Betaproteobacteria bacterium RIFCSPLOWO2_12_FULL_63_13]|nr:MAG: hypothetical protein A3H32_03620 [Betaproteobacteria bacterium RIFCSPLOWO2_02_FULL_63_19]OGA46926.1 MAG: hypothetical protein A3G25_19700 [Betaproteobacteria bacterium RIFCSPLOWO2_12_FULL_63_13]